MSSIRETQLLGLPNWSGNRGMLFVQVLTELCTLYSHGYR